MAADTIIQVPVSIESGTEEIVLAGIIYIKPFEQIVPEVSNSGRIERLEQAYRLLQWELLS